MGMFVVNEECRFPGDHEGLRQSRRRTRRALVPIYPQILDDAELCVDEAFTNALVHTRSGTPGGRVTLRLYALWCGPLYIDVLDEGPLKEDDRPAVDPYALDLGAERGRGLFLISRLTHYWSYVPGAHGGCLCLAFNVPALEAAGRAASG
ncbi:ATP-binding protein [Allosalinactinospora lopnorensis]|uniref:ATP-binding protein n=1 Tax=Allosalinactinospora lopnorensis TaxID=1352348 RepID=UPI000623F7B6|nr:ATP-binding protein [Allosalinactinospora lopnorensis]